MIDTGKEIYLSPAELQSISVRLLKPPSDSPFPWVGPRDIFALREIGFWHRVKLMLLPWMAS